MIELVANKCISINKNGLLTHFTKSVLVEAPKLDFTCLELVGEGKEVRNEVKNYICTC